MTMNQKISNYNQNFNEILTISKTLPFCHIYDKKKVVDDSHALFIYIYIYIIILKPKDQMDGPRNSCY